MTDPAVAAPRLSRLPVIAAAVALAFAMAYLAYVVSHHRRLKPATLSLSVLPKRGAPEPRLLTDGASVDMTDKLDLQVTLLRPAYVYLFVSELNKVSLVWQPDPTATPWDTGTYSPDWDATLFTEVGSATLTAVASERPQHAAARWGATELSSMKAVCPECAVSSLSVTVTGTLPKLAEPPGPRADPSATAPSGY